METAWLVVNGYLKSEKFEEIYSWLIEAAKERNINLKKLPNDQLDSIIPADPENVNWRERPEFVLFGIRMSIWQECLKEKASGYLIMQME